MNPFHRFHRTTPTPTHTTDHSDTTASQPPQPQPPHRPNAEAAADRETDTAPDTTIDTTTTTPHPSHTTTASRPTASQPSTSDAMESQSSASSSPRRHPPTILAPDMAAGPPPPSQPHHQHQQQQQDSVKGFFDSRTGTSDRSLTSAGHDRPPTPQNPFAQTAVVTTVTDSSSPANSSMGPEFPVFAPLRNPFDSSQEEDDDDDTSHPVDDHPADDESSSYLPVTLQPSSPPKDDDASTASGGTSSGDGSTTTTTSSLVAALVHAELANNNNNNNNHADITMDFPPLAFPEAERSGVRVETEPIPFQPTAATTRAATGMPLTADTRDADTTTSSDLSSNARTSSDHSSNATDRAVHGNEDNVIDLPLEEGTNEHDEFLDARMDPSQRGGGDGTIADSDDYDDVVYPDDDEMVLLATSRPSRQRIPSDGDTELSPLRKNSSYASLDVALSGASSNPGTDQNQPSAAATSASAAAATAQTGSTTSSSGNKVSTGTSHGSSAPSSFDFDPNSYSYDGEEYEINERPTSSLSSSVPSQSQLPSSEMPSHSTSMSEPLPTQTELVDEDDDEEEDDEELTALTQAATGSSGYDLGTSLLPDTSLDDEPRMFLDGNSDDDDDYDYHNNNNNDSARLPVYDRAVDTATGSSYNSNTSSYDDDTALPTRNTDMSDSEVYLTRSEEERRAPGHASTTSAIAVGAATAAAAAAVLQKDGNDDRQDKKHADNSEGGDDEEDNTSRAVMTTPSVTSVEGDENVVESVTGGPPSELSPRSSNSVAFSPSTKHPNAAENANENTADENADEKGAGDEPMTTPGKTLGAKVASTIAALGLAFSSPARATLSPSAQASDREAPSSGAASPALTNDSSRYLNARQSEGSSLGAFSRSDDEIFYDCEGSTSMNPLGSMHSDSDRPTQSSKRNKKGSARVQSQKEKKFEYLQNASCRDKCMLLFAVIFWAGLAAMLFFLIRWSARGTPNSRESSSVAVAPSASPSLRGNPTPAPSNTMVPTVPRNPLMELLVSSSFDNGQALMTPDTPQSRAFEWLEDNANLTTYSEHKQLVRYALATFYYSTEGDNWLERDGWVTDVDECEWFTGSQSSPCNSAGLLQDLDLSFNDLAGSLPAELGLLSDHLMTISIGGGPGKMIGGSVPTELGHLSKLQELRLTNHALTGTLPSEMGGWSGMRTLTLSGNQLTGQLPPEIGSLTDLFLFNAEKNSLTGPLPSELGNLVRLKTLSFTSNRLESLPTDIGLLVDLIFLELENNALRGGLVTEIGLLQELRGLKLGKNNLTESIPSELGSLARLTELDLSENMLVGTIPSELASIPNQLRMIRLNDNALTGMVPSSFAFLSGVVSLYLQSNSLTGAVPGEVCSVFNVTLPEVYVDCEEVECTCCNYCCKDASGCECSFANTTMEWMCF